MRGTEDDIRNEIVKAGGTGTESQIQALTAARNKTFLKQATSLSEQIQAKEDYIDHLMQFSQLDRASVEKQVDRKIGLIEKVATLKNQMDTASRTNYQKIVDNIGYSGLAKTMQGNKQMQGYAEQTLGLPKGSLSNQGWLTQAETFRQQQLAQGQQRINISVGGAEGAGGSGSIDRDAESVMSGNLNLQDISTKNNYRARVASEINKRAEKALKTGDIFGVMKASAAYDKEPSDTFTTSMEKLGIVLGQIGVLQENISQGVYYDEEGKKHTFSTGPIEGSFRGLNPWDTKAQTIKAQLNAIVPNLARGIYGEVGVLTDNDIKNYAKTLPNLKSTEDIRNAVLYITVDMIRKNAEIKIKNQAAAQRDMSGYADYYKNIVSEADNILTKLPGSARPAQQTVTPTKGTVKYWENATYLFDGTQWKKQI